MSGANSLFYSFLFGFSRDYFMFLGGLCCYMSIVLYALVGGGGRDWSDFVWVLDKNDEVPNR